MQIHELNTMTNKPGETDYLAIDSGFDTAKISADELLKYNAKKPVDEYGNPINGNEGQILRSKGDGSTEWSDIGNPTDEQTEQAINKWLDDHPEATTTVADGSLTEAKFTDALKKKTVNAYVTPEMFGAVGDGVTDDTTAVQAAIDYCQSHDTFVLLPTYYLVSSLDIHFDGLTIEGRGKTNCGFIKGTDDDLFYTSQNGVFYFTFRDFRINANHTNGAVFKSVSDHRLSSFLVDNVVIAGADTAFDLRDSYVSNITNCLLDTCNIAVHLYDCNAINILGCSINECQKGLYINSNSTCVSLENCTIQSCENAVLCYSFENLRIVGNYFEYNENNDFAIVHLDGTTSRNCNTVTILSNRFAPQGTQGSTLPIKLMYVVKGLVAINRFSNYYTQFLYIDENCGSILYDYSIDSKYTNKSNYCRGLLEDYIEGTTNHPATIKGTMAWDRYRDRPIWWTGSKWIYADGSTRT